ncbi:hypothetical protein ACFQ07_25770 [Actinomadura adrarensis]|uniref:Uncharacterized protein n=1 Tax=Actinomadura adrarensis TaxID=1819600 RepID=A0ABW3CQ69_9ACTN
MTEAELTAAFTRDDRRPEMEDPLVIALEFAVPLHILELADRTDTQRMEIGRRTARLIGEKGDILMFGGGRKGEVADAFNALAQGLAALAYQPGGVEAFGRHWCVHEHEWCPPFGDPPPHIRDAALALLNEADGPDEPDEGDARPIFDVPTGGLL